MGFFKFNKMHGIGLIVYPDGSMIYGNFNQGQLEGVALTDNSRQMHLGTYQSEGIVGIGFEYSYSKMSWKMCRYHKHVPLDLIKQQRMEERDQSPQMLNFQPQILQHFIRYKSKQFFLSQNQRDDNFYQNLAKSINDVFFHKQSPSLEFYGAIIDTKYEGIGLLYDSNNRIIL